MRHFEDSGLNSFYMSVYADAVEHFGKSKDPVSELHSFDMIAKMGLGNLSFCALARGDAYRDLFDEASKGQLVHR